MDDFKFKDIYRMRGGHRRDGGNEYIKFMKNLRRLMLVKKKRSWEGNMHGGGGGGVGSERQQLCTAKMYYGSSREKHLAFLRDYLPQNNKKDVLDKPDLFSDVPVDALFIEDYIRKADDKYFKFIISPEDQNVDMQALVKSLILKMEAMTGYNFSWIAAVHRNTKHVHAHILINNVCRDGMVIDRFGPDFVRNTVRKMAGQICTDIIGPRTDEAVAAARARMPEASRFCLLDKKIEILEKPSDGLGRWGSTAITGDTTLRHRLDYLAGMGLAEYDAERRVYLLERGWKDKLKYVGRYNSFLSARSELKYTLPSMLELYNPEMGDVEGVVTKVYRKDESNEDGSWKDALVIEDKLSGRAWYYPVRFGGVDRYKEGMEVKVTVESSGGRRRSRVLFQRGGRGRGEGQHDKRQ